MHALTEGPLVDNAIKKLQNSIAIDRRGNVTSRSIARALRRESVKLRKCVYCGKDVQTPIVETGTSSEGAQRGSKYYEACIECDTIVSNMHVNKSNLLAGRRSLKALIDMKRYYTTLQTIPHALRGREGVSRIDIVETIDEVLVAIAAQQRSDTQAWKEQGGTK